MGVFIVLIIIWLIFYIYKRAEKRYRLEHDYLEPLDEIHNSAHRKNKTIHVTATISTAEPEINFSSGITVTVKTKSSELFTDAFIQSCSSFKTWSELSDSHFPPDTDLGTVPPDELDAFVKANTTYPDWKTMLLAASKQWTTSKFGIENPVISEISSTKTIYKKE